jgi:hypothetical protein
VTYDAATRVATLNPGSNLVAGVSYTATITTAASDLAGNTLLAAHTWAFTTAAPANTATFLSAGDTYTRAATPTKNYGLESSFKVRAPSGGGTSQTHLGFVRFDVAGLNGRTVTGVTLRLFSLDAGPNGGAVYRTTAPWSETSVTHDTAPTQIGTKLADVGSVAMNTWRDIALPATLITEDGAVGFRISPATTKLLGYASRQSANAPQLILTFAATGLTGAGLSATEPTADPTMGVTLAPSGPTAGPTTNEGDDPEPTPTARPAPSPTPAPAPSPTATSTPTATPNPTAEPAPSPSPSPSPKPKGKGKPSPSPGPTPTP